MKIPVRASKDNRSDAGGVRIGQIVFGCAILAFLSFFASLVFKSGAFRPLGDYETVPCRIERSSVKHEQIDRFVLTVEYSYDYGGRSYTSSTLRTPDSRTYDFSDLACRLPILEKFAPGSVHTCRVPPSRPANAVLPIENPVEDDFGAASAFIMVFPAIVLLIFFVVAVGIIVFAFPSIRRRFTTRKTKSLTGAFLILFSLPFALIGTGGLVWTFRTRADIAGYVPVPAKVLYSGVTHHASNGGRRSSTVYGVCVGYEYSVDGKNYESSRYSRPAISTSDYKRHRREAETYRRGDEVTAYVSPRDPRRSVLKQKDSTAGFVLPLAMGTFALVGFALMGGGLWTLVASVRAARRAVAYDGRRLRRSHANLVSLGAFAAFWNLISWSVAGAFLSDAFADGWRIEHLFVSIFPLVGLGLALAFISNLVRELRAPKLLLTLTCAAWERGAGAQVDWQLNALDAVESLEIVLEGARAERHGKQSRRVVVSSERCCRHDAPVPLNWRFGFTVPDVASDGLSWALSVRLRARGVRKAYAWLYPL